MKKGLIILFLGLLMYNTIGFIINFHFVLAEWRQEMRLMLSQNMDDNDFVPFTFHKTQFDISTDEFLKDNKWFDVVKTKISGDSITVYCFQDDEETALTTQFNDFLFQNTHTKGDFQKKMFTIFKHLYMEYVFENSFFIQKLPPSVFYAPKTVLDYKNCFFSISNSDILTPPPQQIG